MPPVIHQPSDESRQVMGMGKVIPLASAGATTQLQLRIELLDMSPAVWRSVIAPAAITLPKLHRVIQAAMGWEDVHLHEFEIAGHRYGEPDPDLPDDALINESRATLAACLNGATSFGYIYDFGDDWQHRITVDSILSGDAPLKAAHCIAGEGACPPEDVGGTGGYADLLEVLCNPQHEDYQHRVQWCGGPIDPQYFDLEKTQRRLSKIKL